MLQYYLLCRDNDQANGSRVLSQQSNLCHDTKSYRMTDFCHDKKRKSNETSQDKFVVTKILMLQQTVKLATNSSASNKDQGRKYVATFSRSVVT